MLAIANTLATSPQGHSVHFMSFADDKILVKSMPIAFHSLGPSPLSRESLRKKQEELQKEEIRQKGTWWGMLTQNEWIGTAMDMARFYQYGHIRYASTYASMLRVMRRLQPDVVVCDFLAEACADAAATLDIPLVIFSPFANMFDMSSSPYTTSFMSPLPVVATPSMGLIPYLLDKYIFPWFIFLVSQPSQWRMRRLRQELGIPNPHLSGKERLSNASIIINSWIGYDPPLPLPANSRMVGPLRRSEKTSPYADEDTFSKQQNLPEPLNEFLGNRSSVLYISLGTNAVAPPQLIRRIILGTQRAVEAGLIDGAIWSLGNMDPEMMTMHYPHATNTSDDLLMLPSVPQIQVLRHPSIRVFWGHCGASSTIEGILSGLPLIMTPIFADQPKTSRRLEALGISRTLEKKGEDVQEVVDTLDWALHCEEAAKARTIQTLLAKSASQFGMAQAVSIIESSAIAGPTYSSIPPTPVHLPGLNMLFIPLGIIAVSLLLVKKHARALGK